MRDVLVSPGNVCYAEKRKYLFGSVSWANSNNLKFCRTFGRTILVTSGVSKKNSKSHDYSRLFSQEKRRQKTRIDFKILIKSPIKTGKDFREDYMY